MGEAAGLATVDPARAARAVHLDARRQPDGSWIVTGGKEPHRVDAGGASCDCKSFRFGKNEPCKHLLKVRQEMAEEEEALAGMDARFQEEIAEHRARTRDQDAPPPAAPDDLETRPLRIWTLAELDAQPELEWQIAGVMPSRTVGMVFGPTGAGKSFVVLDACATIASGEGQWFGRSVRGGTVVYVAAEAAHSLRNRVRAWRRNHLHAHPALFVIPDAVQLMSPFDVGAIIAAVEKVATAGVALIVFDTWAKVTPGGDENTTKDMGQALGGIDRICRHFNCGALIVHHTGSNPEKNDSPRGATAVLASVDWAWIVTERQGARRIRCKKMRDGEPFEPIDFQLRPLAPSCVIEPADPPEDLSEEQRTPNQQKALAPLSTDKSVSATYWESASGLSHGTWSRMRKELLDLELIVQDEKGYRKVPTTKEVPNGTTVPRARGTKVPTPLGVVPGTDPGTGSGTEPGDAWEGSAA